MCGWFSTDLDGRRQHVRGERQDIRTARSFALMVDEPLGPRQWWIVANGLNRPRAKRHGLRRIRDIFVECFVAARRRGECGLQSDPEVQRRVTNLAATRTA